MGPQETKRRTATDAWLDMMNAGLSNQYSKLSPDQVQSIRAGGNPKDVPKLIIDYLHSVPGGNDNQRSD